MPFYSSVRVKDDVPIWDGAVKPNEDLHVKALIFRKRMMGLFKLEGCLDVIQTDDHVRIGMDEAITDDLIEKHGLARVERAQTAWTLIFNKIGYSPILVQVMAAASPSEAWNLFTKFYSVPLESRKSQLRTEWHEFAMKANETPAEYLGRGNVLRNNLRAVGQSFTEHEANQQFVRGLPPSYDIARHAVFSMDVLDSGTLERVLMKAYGELEMARSKGSTMGHAFVAAGPSRSGSGGGGGLGGRGMGRASRGSERAPGRAHAWCNLHQTHLHDDSECIAQQGSTHHTGHGGRGGRGFSTVGQQQPGATRGGRGFSTGGQQQPGVSRGGRGFGGRAFGGRAPPPQQQHLQQQRQQQRAPGGRGYSSAGAPRYSPGAPQSRPPGSMLPAYPEPPGGYDYSRYPSHLPRPTGNEPPIHFRDPRQRCITCGELGHMHLFCPLRVSVDPPVQDRPPHAGPAWEPAPWPHSYGVANTAQAEGASYYSPGEHSQFSHAAQDHAYAHGHQFHEYADDFVEYSDPSWSDEHAQQLEEEQHHHPSSSAPESDPSSSPSPYHLHCCVAQSVPEGEFRLGLNGLGGGAFALAAAVASEASQSVGTETWLSDNGATHHTTSNDDGMYDLRSPPKGRHKVVVGNGVTITVRAVGCLNVMYHMQTATGVKNFCVKLTEVYLLDGIRFNLFSLHQTQLSQRIVLDAKGVHLFGGELVFPWRETGSFLRASRLPSDYGVSRVPPTVTDVTGVMPSVNGMPTTLPCTAVPAVSPGFAQPDMSVFLDEELMGGVDNSNPADFFPRAMTVAEQIEQVGVEFMENAASVLAPAKHPFSVGKPTKDVDINFFHVSLSHANETLLRATAEQQGIQLTGVLQPCAGCAEAKGRRASVSRRHGLRAGAVLDVVHLDLTGPHPRTLGGSYYMLMCVDSKSRLMMPYGLVRKSDTLAMVKRFIADVSAIGFPRCFRMDNGSEFLSREFTSFCDDAGIRREYTAPGTPQQNAVVENAIWRVMKAGHAARREALRLFPSAGITRVPHLNENLDTLWLEAAVWAADCFNRSATTANPGRISPYEVFSGKRPHLQLVPFMQPGMMRVHRSTKSAVQSVPCFFLNNGRNHSTAAVKVLRASTGFACISKDVVWTVPRVPLLPPVPAAGGGGATARAATAPPEHEVTFVYQPQPQSPPPPPPPPSPPQPLRSRTVAASPARKTTFDQPPSSPPQPQPQPQPRHRSPSAVTAPPLPSPRAGTSATPTPQLRSPPPRHRSSSAVAASPLPPPRARTSVSFTPQPRSPPSSPTAPVPSPHQLPSPQSPLDPYVKKHLGLEFDPRQAGNTRSQTRYLNERQQQQESSEPPPPDNSFVHQFKLLPATQQLALLSALVTDNSGGHGSGTGAAGGPEAIACPTVMAKREDIELSRLEERPPLIPPDPPRCQASDLDVPRSYSEAMRSEHATLWSDSMAREHFGLLDAGTFEPL